MDFDEKSVRQVFPMGIEEFDMDSNKDYRIDHWSGTDSEALYQRNFQYMTKLGLYDSWKWKKPNKIEYHRNRNGLRLDYHIDKNFDFSEKYVLLGCSFVEGIGINRNETISAWMTKLSGIDTINFGNGGTGCDIVFYNVMWLTSLKNPPKKIFIQWPQVQRFSRFLISYHDTCLVSANDNRKILDPFILPNRKMYKKFWKDEYMLQPENQSAHKLIWKQIIKNMWGDNVIELDILDNSEFNPTYDDDAKSAVNDREKRSKLTPEEFLNYYCARDITKQTIDMTLKGWRSPSGCHWGSHANRDVAKWLLAQ